MGPKEDKFILWFDEIGMADVHVVGAKIASLGEMIRNLAARVSWCPTVLLLPPPPTAIS